MMYRRVVQTDKDANGEITALCNPGHIWSPVPKERAIEQIENGTHLYYAYENGYSTRVRVVYCCKSSCRKKHLHTTSDRESKNSLNNLPDYQSPVFGGW